jgi:hypothetical protein
MRILRVAAGAVAALALGAAAARTQPLTVVEVNAPAVNCVFHPACTITVSDSVGFIPLPYLVAPKTAFLQSRTFSGAAGTPAAGKAGYMYPNKVADVFVITSGGLGSVGVKSAERFGEVIVFDLAKPLCLDGGPNLANTTFFFGLAADTPAMATSAQIFSSGNPPLYSVDARVPSH